MAWLVALDLQHDYVNAALAFAIARYCVCAFALVYVPAQRLFSAVLYL
jgi:hypothetical protein